jgi:glycosyltransferase involved in cell wall biosynthesis
MKILLVNGVRRVREAGAAGVVFHHAEELEKLGHQVEMWFLDDILAPPRWPGRFEMLEFATAVSRRIRQNPSKFDVVVLHAPSGCAYGLHRKLFSSQSLPPYVLFMHGCEERYTVAMRIEERKGRATNFALKNRIWHRLYHQTLYDFAISTANFGAVVNREGWLISELKHKHPSGHIWYIPNGVGPEFFQPHSYTESPDRLLYVGTWLDRKGIYYLVDAFAELASTLPQLSLTVAGCSLPVDRIRADFPEPVRSRVNVIPFLTRAEMPALYTSHDIFVFPSLMEGMPLTLLEAMASAMPIVTTTSGGMADLIENEFTGLLVPAADAPACASAIHRMYHDAPLRQNLGFAAQETAKRYSWRAVTAQLEHVLKLAVQAQKAATSA